MKGMKKLLSILMVLTLVLSLGASALAATVTVETSPGHNYTAYQIFKGDNQNAEGTIGNLTWGEGIKVNDFVAALKTAGYVSDVEAADGNYNTPEIAKAVAEALVKLGSNSDGLKTVARIASEHVEGSGTVLTNGGADLPIGYYVILDTTSVEGKDEVKNEVVLQVSGDVNVQFKADKPSSDKKVKDINDSQASSESSWQDGADHDIGDKVHYQLHAKLPSDVTTYKSYYLQFVDTLSKGLTFAETIKVTIGTKDYTANNIFTCSGAQSIPAIDTDHESRYPGGTQVTWTCEDLIKAITDAGGQASDLNGADVYIEYDATLNTDAVIGGEGNPNEMHIVYSNTPEGTGHGQNGDDKVTVFTFELDVEKTDGEGNPLERAGFTLYKKDSASDEYKQVGNEVKATANSDKFIASFDGLDDGEYKIVESTTPPGFNTAEDILFTVTAEHTDNGDPQTVTSLKVTVTSPEDSSMSVTGNKTITTTVANQSGVTLPETGGIGTTIFYVAGAILVAGAAILLVTKKRVNGAEK